MFIIHKSRSLPGREREENLDTYIMNFFQYFSLVRRDNLFSNKSFFDYHFSTDLKPSIKLNKLDRLKPWNTSRIHSRKRKEGEMTIIATFITNFFLFS